MENHKVNNKIIGITKSREENYSGVPKKYQPEENEEVLTICMSLENK